MDLRGLTIDENGADVQELDVLDIVSEIWPVQPDVKKIHIYVKLPAPAAGKVPVFLCVNGAHGCVICRRFRSLNLII
jgi:hypothetical protein